MTALRGSQIMLGSLHNPGMSLTQVCLFRDRLFADMCVP